MKLSLKIFLFSILFAAVVAGAAPVSAAEYTVPGDYATIQAAVDGASPGDTIVVSGGPYEEQVVVDKELLLSGTGGPVIDGGEVSGTSTLTLAAEQIVVEGFTITGGRNNGVLVSAGNTTIRYCNISGNRGIAISVGAVAGTVIHDCLLIGNYGSSASGISLNGASGTKISNSTIIDSNVMSIDLDAATDTTIHNNTLSGAGWHNLYIVSSSTGTVVTDNLITGALYGAGTYLSGSNFNTVTGNTVTNNSEGGIIIASSDDVTISDNTVSGNSLYGILPTWSDRNIITGNIVEANPSLYEAALYLDYADDSVVADNIVRDHDLRGLYLHYSENNTLTNNTMTDNLYNFGITGDLARYYHHQIDETNTADGKPVVYLLDDVGGLIDASSNAATVYCVDCTGTVIANLTLSNTSYGVVFWNTDAASVTNVSVSGCEDGIVLYTSDGNTVNFSSFDAADRGIYLDASSNANRFYLNTVAGDSADVFSAATDTSWSTATQLLYYYLGSGYTSYLGNNWSAYAGTDSDGNGIGETPFAIATDSDDDYPLVAPHTAYTFASSQPPVAAFSWSPVWPDTADTIQFTDESVDPDGTVVGWEWDFGDGGSASTADPQHQYGAAGWYTVVLNVTDDLGTVDNTSAALFVHETGPMAIWVPDNATTIQGAVNTARDGDTVMVRPGIYPEQVVVNKSVTLTGLDTPVLDALGGTGFNITSDNCVLEGFNVTNATGFGVAGVLVAADGATVRNMTVADGYSGIACVGVGGGTLQNNTCTGNEYNGILLWESSAMTVRNNTCTGNGAYNAEGGQGYGIKLVDSPENTLYFNRLDNMDASLPGLYHNAFDSNSTLPASTWYNAALQRGNWYTDYYGTDDNHDGVGDTPYTIADNYGTPPNRDLYPLMNENPVPDYPPIIGDIDVGAIAASSAEISWNIENLIPCDNRVWYGTDPALANGTWSDWVNATVTPSVALAGLTWNSTYYFQCYSQSAVNASANSTSSTESFDTLERPPGVITVDDDNLDIPVPPADYSSILAALAASMDGDTILVYPGAYTGYHEVATSVNLTGIGWPVVTGSQDSPLTQIGDVFAFRADDCILQGFVIEDGWWHNQSGISSTPDSAAVRAGTMFYNINQNYWSIGSADNITVRNNRIENANCGIILNPNSNDNTIEGNTVNRTWCGVWLWHTRNNNFTGNTVTNCKYDSLLNTNFNSGTTNTNNRITDNTFDTSYMGTPVTISGGTSGNIVANNTLLNQATLIILGDGNTVENNTVAGPCESHFPGIRIGGDGNIVGNNTVANQKFGIMLYGDADNLVMTGNTITGCTYGFGYAGDIGYASSRPARNVIDTTNTVDGDPIYWIVGETGAVYNYGTLIPAPGYLAIIGCRDVLVEDFYLEKNAQSVLVHQSENVTLDGVTAHGNAYQGILIGDSCGITIRDSHADSNGEDVEVNYRQAGIWATNTSNSLVLDSELTANNPAGVFFEYDCTDNAVIGCDITNNGHSTHAFASYGIRNDGSDNSNFTVTGCTIGNTFATRQGIGIANYGDDSLFYNNRLFNHTVANAQNWGDGTRWNVTPTAATNIIGGPWTAGNYWDDYAGEDTDGDGLGDTLLPYETAGNVPGQDQHPLTDTFIPDTDPPVIFVYSPQEGENYPAALVPLEVWSPDADVAAWWYSLDSAANASFVPNTTLASLVPGAHTLVVFASDTSGNENSTMVNFTAQDDTDPPVIYVYSPEENTTYTTSTVPLEVWSPDADVFSWWYAVDNGTDRYFAANTTISHLSNGNHTLAVSADDLTGNANTTLVNFTVDAAEPYSGGENDDSPAVYPAPPEEPSEFAIAILTPEPVRTTRRFAELTYSAPVALARAWYRLDDGATIPVTPGAAVPIERLTLGYHEIVVVGVDTAGRYGEGMAGFEVIPLAIGEESVVGTEEFPDEAAFGFDGQTGAYTLRFEANTGEAETIAVMVNQYLAGTCGADAEPVAWLAQNGQVETIAGPTAGWQAYTVEIPSDLVVPDTENIISFIHSENPGRTSGLAVWQVRNVELAPVLDASAPSIRVFSPDQALRPGDEMMAWVKISGVAADDEYTATVYLVSPDGTLSSFPDGGEPAPLDDRYVRDNHYGRLPGAVAFSADDPAGTYRLVATLSQNSSGTLVSLSSVPVYFSTTPSVQLFVNREMLGEGMPLKVTAAVTGGETPLNATLVTVLQRPQGADRYLPGGTEESGALDFAPLGSEYLTVLDETVGPGYPDGAYLVRSVLFDEDGNILAEDTAAFTVERDEGTVVVRFPAEASGSRVVLTDALTLDRTASMTTTTPHDEVRVSVPPGTYWVTGVITEREGGTLIIPADARNRVVVSAGETIPVLVNTRPVSVLGEAVA